MHDREHRQIHRGEIAIVGPKTPGRVGSVHSQDSGCVRSRPYPACVSLVPTWTTRTIRTKSAKILMVYLPRLLAAVTQGSSFVENRRLIEASLSSHCFE